MADVGNAEGQAVPPDSADQSSSAIGLCYPRSSANNAFPPGAEMYDVGYSRSGVFSDPMGWFKVGVSPY